MFIFKTTTTMKPHNCQKWWIDRNYIGEIAVEAASLDTAIEQYRKIVNDKYYVTISDNAIKTKNPMYVDTADGGAKQVGFVITGKTEFEYGRKWIPQYIDLWTTILTVVDTEFEAA